MFTDAVLKLNSLQWDMVPAWRHNPSFLHQSTLGSLPPGTLLRKPDPKQGPEGEFLEHKYQVCRHTGVPH